MEMPVLKLFADYHEDSAMHDVLTENLVLYKQQGYNIVFIEYFGGQLNIDDVITHCENILKILYVFPKGIPISSDSLNTMQNQCLCCTNKIF
jgi:hypothetical protein